MAISRFDEGALGSALIGYWNAAESVLTKNGNIVTNVQPAYSGVGPILATRSSTPNDIFHDGTTKIGACEAFYDDSTAYRNSALFTTTGFDQSLDAGATFVCVSERVVNAGSDGQRSFTSRSSSTNLVIIDGRRGIEKYRIRINGVNDDTDIVVRDNEPCIEIVHHSAASNSQTLEVQNTTDGLVTYSATHSTPSMDNMTQLYWMGSNATNASIRGKSCLLAIYNRDLTAQEILDVRELCQYWVDNGEAPSVAPSGEFSITVDKPDAAGLAFQWEESADDTNYQNVGTILTDTTGANTDTLAINSATVAMHETYVRCQVTTDNDGSDISDSAQLLIQGQAAVAPPTVIFQNNFDGAAGVINRDSGVWATDAQRVPTGFDASYSGSAEFRIEAGEGESGDGNACVLDYIDRTEPPDAPEQPRITLGKHLTGDQSTGFDELYIRYKVRLPDAWPAGDPATQLAVTYWKWFRLWQNTGTDPNGGTWTENRIDSYYVVANFGGTLDGSNGADINSAWGRTYDSAPGDSNGGPRTDADWFQSTAKEEHATVRGNFEHVGGNWDSNEGPLTRGAWELRKDDNSYQLLNAGQTWHTVEYRVKLGTGTPTSEEELNWDAEMEVWFDGISQGPPVRYMYKDWAPYANQAPAPGLSTTRNTSGWNHISVFDNMTRWNLRWIAEDGRVFLDDVVVSTDRIGHAYDVTENTFSPGMGT